VNLARQNEAQEQGPHGGVVAFVPPRCDTACPGHVPGYFTLTLFWLSEKFIRGAEYLRRLSCLRDVQQLFFPQWAQHVPRPFFSFIHIHNNGPS
jgi:hypothetical protein